MTTVLRPMRWWDIDPVLALEQQTFPDDAWSPAMFWSELADTRHPGASRYYVVAERIPQRPRRGQDRRIVGYAGLMVVGDQGDVQTIAVARDRWGSGLGSLLLADLIRQATAFECREILLEVRIDNTRAQRLYERFGFQAIGLRRGYYQPGNVDALVMRRTEPTPVQGTTTNG